MGDLSGRAFRVLIAYLIPGFVCVLGASAFVPALQDWLALNPSKGGEHAQLSYVLLLSLAIGMMLHVLRWAVVDSLHARTGVKRPNWNDGALSQHLPAYEALVELCYGYYEFCANTALAIMASYAPLRFAGRFPSELGAKSDVLVGVLVIVLLAGSRNTLQNYYRRVNQLLGPTPDNRERSTVMTNGGGHHEEGAPSPTTRKDNPKVSPDTKPPKKSAGNAQARTVKSRN
jgi:hypothetical protein